jgi:hypothetical protein
VHAPGFGLFDVAIYNGNMTPNGGDKDEIQAGDTFTFVMDIVPAGAAVDVCDFISENSIIPPGSPCNTLRNVVARYQAGPVGDESGVIGPCSPELAVELVDFRVAPGDRQVRVSWETASEIDNAAFNVLRREKIRGASEIVNALAIPARGNTLEGQRYEFLDATAVNGVEYEYSLEDVDNSGRNTFHGPRRVIANPETALIQLVSPAYGGETSARGRFAFATELKGRVELQISADPTFRDRSLSVLTGAGRRSEVILGTSEIRQVEEMARGSAGVLYWRVLARDSSSSGRSNSSTFMFRLGPSAR